MAYALVIGSKNVSSWSLRPWLALVEAGIPFQEILIPCVGPTPRPRSCTTPLRATCQY